MLLLSRDFALSIRRGEVSSPVFCQCGNVPATERVALRVEQDDSRLGRPRFF